MDCDSILRVSVASARNNGYLKLARTRCGSGFIPTISRTESAACLLMLRLRRRGLSRLFGLLRASAARKTGKDDNREKEGRD